MARTVRWLARRRRWGDSGVLSRSLPSRELCALDALKADDQLAQELGLAQDDYGKLWRTDVRIGGERIQLVEVVNATAEPDGSFRRYFLRVPPTARTARQAVAWTFGFEAYVVAAAS